MKGEIVVKTAVKQGNSAHVGVPKKWIGHQIVCEDTGKEGEIKPKCQLRRQKRP